MKTGTLPLSVALFAVIAAYAYLKVRDSRLKNKGATTEQLKARSQMTVQNTFGALLGVNGVGFLLMGVWFVLEAHLNGEHIPWGKGGVLVILGICFLALSVGSLSAASKSKELSRSKSNRQ